MKEGAQDLLLYIFGGLVLLVMVLYAIRQLVLWYYKIDKRCELLQQQNEILKRMAENQGINMSDIFKDSKKE
ncbi:hypothetical protein ES705_51174 [subsurface metagenome]